MSHEGEYQVNGFPSSKSVTDDFPFLVMDKCIEYMIVKM